MSKVKTSLELKPLETIKLYKYMPWEIAEKVLTNWELKLTLPHQANDPFEWMPAKGVEYPWSDQSEKLCDRGFLCFSKNLESAALWGHYADSHRGVCLEFTVPVRHPEQNSMPIFPLSSFLSLQKVKYSPNRFNKKCEAQSSDDPDGDEWNNDTQFDMFNELVTTKDKSWEFEQEYRIIHHIHRATRVQDGMIFTNILMGYLSGIYLGLRCPHNTAYVVSWLYHIIKTKQKHLLYSGEKAVLEDGEDLFSQDITRTSSDDRILLDYIDVVQMKCHDHLFRVEADLEHRCSMRIQVRKSTIIKKEGRENLLKCTDVILD